MSSEINMKYSERVKTVEHIISELQTCDDVDDAIALFERASEHLKECERKLEHAQGKFNKMVE